MGLLRDRRADFEAAGVRLLGISRDSPYCHVAWAHALDLDFALLSDWNAEAAEAFGIAREYRGLHGVPARSAFLVDGDGVVRAIRRYGDDDVPDMDDLVAEARALRI